MRIIIYTGKGGVGKTSMAAATASKIARDGKKVLVMSTDQAHSLGDSFDRKVGKTPVEIAENLHAVEIDTVYESERSWGNLKGYVKQLLTVKGGGGIEAEELLVFPGLEELFSMFKILDVYESGVYDTVIVDCAPTGETLSLLKYPERLSELIKRILSIERAATKTIGKMIERTMKVPMPKDNVFDDIESLMERMKNLQRLLLDKDTVSLRVVTTPEKIVISEAKRNFTCLYLYHYNVDAVIVNHIYPARAMEGYFNKWTKMQEEALRGNRPSSILSCMHQSMEEALREIAECFSEVPRFYVELQQRELRTLEMLESVGDQIFEGCDPNDVLFRQKIYEVSAAEKSMRIYLPFASREELRLEQESGELLVGVRNESRRFPIPPEFARMEVAGAKFEGGYLNISFQ